MIGREKWTWAYHPHYRDISKTIPLHWDCKLWLTFIKLTTLLSEADLPGTHPQFISSHGHGFASLNISQVQWKVEDGCEPSLYTVSHSWCWIYQWHVRLIPIQHSQFFLFLTIVRQSSLWPLLLPNVLRPIYAILNKAHSVLIYNIIYEYFHARRIAL